MFRPSAATRISRLILGASYDLSFSYIDSARSRELNLRFRGKDKPANVMSFPLSPTSGEILIDRQLVPAKTGQLKLLIHGLLHLKGFRHGSRMLSEENKILKIFLNGQARRRRAGYRH